MTIETPLALLRTLPTNTLTRLAAYLAAAEYGAESHHLADTLTPGHVETLCREFDELLTAWTDYADAGSRPHSPEAAHLRDEGAQVAALILAMLDKLGPASAPRWDRMTPAMLTAGKANRVTRQAL